MNQALANAITTVTRERGGQFEEAFRAASQLVAQYGEPELAERILSEVPASVPWEVVADLLGILVWSTQDNGAALQRSAEQWLIEGSDRRRVQIALHLEAYPFLEFEQMRVVLARLALAHPQVAARCEWLIQQRRADECKD